MSEFLDYRLGDSEREKQDCELRAFFRLTERLKKAFPHLPIMLLLDGLFACGPVMERCRDYGWHYMIVLQDKSLPYVWQEFRGLRRMMGAEGRLEQRWGDRHQLFEMVNDIDYRWEENQRKHTTLHMVVCQEDWQEINEKGEEVKRTSKWAWICDLPFDSSKVHARCNLAGRHRWSVEEGILTVKQRGYEYEHCYAYDWNAMRGYHCLMHLGHLLNVLASYLSPLLAVVKERGMQGLLAWIRSTLSGLWLQWEQVKDRLLAPFQLRLLFPLPHAPIPSG
jgi:hypothetical protein